MFASQFSTPVPFEQQLTKKILLINDTCHFYDDNLDKMTLAELEEQDRYMLEFLREIKYVRSFSHLSGELQAPIFESVQIIQRLIKAYKQNDLSMRWPALYKIVPELNLKRNSAAILDFLRKDNHHIVRRSFIEMSVLLLAVVRKKIESVLRELIALKKPQILIKEAQEAIELSCVQVGLLENQIPLILANAHAGIAYANLVKAEIDLKNRMNLVSPEVGQVQPIEGSLSLEQIEKCLFESDSLPPQEERADEVNNISEQEARPTASHTEYAEIRSNLFTFWCSPPPLSSSSTTPYFGQFRLDGRDL